MIVCACPMGRCNGGGVLQGKRNFLPHLRVDMLVHHGGQSTSHCVPSPVKGITTLSKQSASKGTVSCWSRVITRIVTV